jgi:hypothetical protein
MTNLVLNVGVLLAEVSAKRFHCTSCSKKYNIQQHGLTSGFVLACSNVLLFNALSSMAAVNFASHSSLSLGVLEKQREYCERI